MKRLIKTLTACLVLIVQLFQKVPTLKALAPTQSEPPFAATQLVVLVLFIAVAIVSATRLRIARA